jgi:hypothetical protein
MLMYRFSHLLTATLDRASLDPAGAAVDAVRGIDR